MNRPGEPAAPPPEPPGREPSEPLLWRVVRSAIAPDVLRDGGHDAPLSARGRLLFGVVIGVLVIGIAVLLVLVALAR